MTEVSALYRQTNFKGDRVIIELTMEDAGQIFYGCARNRDPIEFLKSHAADMRVLMDWQRRARWSVVLFVVVLFFLRRFIP